MAQKPPSRPHASRSPLASTPKHRRLIAARKRAPRHPAAPEARMRFAVAQLFGSVKKVIKESIIHVAPRFAEHAKERTDAAGGLYARILAPLATLCQGDVTCSVIGQTEVGPILVMDLPGDPYVVVVTGQHGEEQAGPLLLARRGRELFDHARSLGIGLRVYPCVNPEGFDRKARRDLEHDTHANSFIQYQFGGKWVNELRPGDVPEAMRRCEMQAPETSSLYDDLVPWAAVHHPVALLDLHQDSLLKGGQVFAYVAAHRREYERMLAGAGVPFASKKLQNSSWSSIEVSTDPWGMATVRDGSVSDWADRAGIHFSLATEASAKNLASAIGVEKRIVVGLLELAAVSRGRESSTYGGRQDSAGKRPVLAERSRLTYDADDPVEGPKHSIFEPLWATSLRELHTSPFKRIVSEAAAKTAESVTDQTSKALDLEPDEFDPDLTDELGAFDSRVEAAMDGYLDQALERAEDMLDDWDGEDIDELDDMLDDSLDGVEGRAIGWVAVGFAALFGGLVKAAQEDAGCGSYVWLTMRDSHVRPAHEDLDGEICSWDDPPLTADVSSNGEDDHPGDDYNCRCVASPVTPEEEDAGVEPGDLLAARGR